MGTKWFLPADKLPFCNQRVRFIDDKGIEHFGIFIENENMFFIGFHQYGSFRFTYQVIAWINYELNFEV